MKTHVLTGSRREIEESVARIDGIIHEVIVLVEEPRESESQNEDIFAEMAPYAVQAGGADYSRQTLYLPAEGE